VVLTGGLDKVFCAGANIRMLAGSSHSHKVNFCKFTNETRNAIEEATAQSGQAWIAAVNGTAAGGGYELALACEEIVLVDDRTSAVSLPEVPLLAVLPGTGGLTRVVDKRKVRRDLADVFATKTEGVKGRQALEWRLVDAIAPPSEFAHVVRRHAEALASRSDRPGGAGCPLPVLGSTTAISDDGLDSRWLSVSYDRTAGTATFVLRAPDTAQPVTATELMARGADAWVLAAALEVDHALLHLRFNEPTLGTWVLTTAGDPDAVGDAERVLGEDHWLAREVRLYWARVLKRLDVSARTLIALVEPGSCCVGTLAELALAADRSLMLDGERDGDSRPPATMRLTAANDGWYPMSNGLSRLASRFWGRDDVLDDARALIGKDLDARSAFSAELITFAPDDIDWDDEVPVMLAERNSFSPDALTAMEANYRFVGPETMETKIFARLTAWQNWVFQRPNAVGSEGALARFGTGSRPTFDRERV
ncbi:MAG TPA: enoyl-CoA hydratase/isomerase family protein, partial [Ilumatobacteraceae bacterium]|nr:enoyl-CoA hydratase/isomerase family protein [Ilumatobacteraceae bacterium]